jgi:hypothetical protein
MKRVEDALRSDLTDHESLDGYALSPPELFPCAASGVDGGHFGYVIHVPELSATDYPVGRFEPSDYDEGVYLLGATTFEAFETELSSQMKYDLNSEFRRQRRSKQVEWWPEAVARLRALGIDPDPAKAGRNYENGSGKPVSPSIIPEGWRHVPSTDGIGVLAPAALFHPAPLPALETVRSSSAAL